ncbi:hypothetical protein, partial [Psittacicella gerlachiana]
MKKHSLALALSALTLLSVSANSQATSLTLTTFTTNYSFHLQNLLNTASAPVFPDRQPQVVAQGVNPQLGTTDGLASLKQFTAKLGDGDRQTSEVNQEANPATNQQNETAEPQSEEPTKTQEPQTPSESTDTSSTTENVNSSTETSTSEDSTTPTHEADNSATTQETNRVAVTESNNSNSQAQTNLLTGGVYLLKDVELPNNVNSKIVEANPLYKNNDELGVWPKPQNPELEQALARAQVTVSGVFSNVELIASQANQALPSNARDPFNNLVADFTSPQQTLAQLQEVVANLEATTLEANLVLGVDQYLNPDLVTNESFAFTSDTTELTAFRSYKVPVSPVNPEGFWPNPLPSLNDFYFTSGGYALPNVPEQVNPFGALIKNYQPLKKNGVYYPEYATYNQTFSVLKVAPQYQDLNFKFFTVQVTPFPLTDDLLTQLHALQVKLQPATESNPQAQTPAESQPATEDTSQEKTESEPQAEPSK